MAQVQRHESSRYGYAKMTIVTSRSIICWTNICKSGEIDDCETQFNILRVRSRNCTRKSPKVILQMFRFIINSRIADRISFILDCYREGWNLTINFCGRNASRYASLLIATSRLMHLYRCILALAIRNCRYWYLFNQSHIPPGSATYTSYTV